MPATNGSATPSVAPTATAASIALPPWRSTSSRAEVASTSSDATAPPVPTATACLGRSLTVCLSIPADAGRLAEPEATSKAATDAAVSTPARNDMSIPPDGWPLGPLIRGRTYPLAGLLNIALAACGVRCGPADPRRRRSLVIVAVEQVDELLGISLRIIPVAVVHHDVRHARLPGQTAEFRSPAAQFGFGVQVAEALVDVVTGPLVGMAVEARHGQVGRHRQDRRDGAGVPLWHVHAHVGVWVAGSGSQRSR